VADLISPATHSAMFEATGGVAVVDGAESCYGHFEQVPLEEETPGGRGVLTTRPSVVIPDGIFTNIGPRIGVDRTITVGGDSWTISRIEPASPDGGVLRLILTS